VPGREATSRRGQQPPVLAQVDAHAIDRQQLGDPLDRRLEGVREREPGDRLAHDGEERARAVELELDPAGALTCA